MGLAQGENRVLEATQKAISSPLLADSSIEGAQGILINITGGRDLMLHEVDKASELIHGLAHPEANIIFGAVIDEAMKDTAKVTVIATGFSGGRPAETAVPIEPPAPVFRKKTPPAVPVFRAPTSIPSDMKPPAQPTVAVQAPHDPETNWDRYEKATFLRNQHTRKRFHTDYEPS